MRAKRRHIRLTFVETGESVVAEMLDDEAPQTCELVWEMLPVEHDLIHGRYSGMEAFVLLDEFRPAPAEQRTRLPLPGEILYGRDFYDYAAKYEDPETELVLTPKEGGMELARDMAERMRDEGKGVILDQFGNPDNPVAHYEGTGPEIWRKTGGMLTHFLLAGLSLLPGFALGVALCALLVNGFESELYRIPLAISPAGLGAAGLVVLAATAGSALLMRRRLDQLDLIAVLKTKD